MATKASSPAAVFLACGLSVAAINVMARESGFTKRSGGKIRAVDFLAQLCAESIKGTVSLNDIAAAIHAHTGVSASRQAYWERLNDEGRTWQVLYPAFEFYRIGPRHWQSQSGFLVDVVDRKKGAAHRLYRCVYVGESMEEMKKDALPSDLATSRVLRGSSSRPPN